MTTTSSTGTSITTSTVIPTCVGGSSGISTVLLGTSTCNREITYNDIILLLVERQFYNAQYFGSTKF